jgi:hypothetical protein
MNQIANWQLLEIECSLKKNFLVFWVLGIQFKVGFVSVALFNNLHKQISLFANTRSQNLSVNYSPIALLCWGLLLYYTEPWVLGHDLF